MNKQDISDIYYDKVHVTRDRYRSLYSYQDDAVLCTYFLYQIKNITFYVFTIQAITIF